MIRCVKPHPLNLLKSFLTQKHHPLRLFGTKSTPRFNRDTRKNSDDEDDNNRRNRNPKNGVEQERIYLDKSRGQHLLTNPRILDAIVRKADIKPTDTVLEIGPGTGNLTLRLAQVAAKVIAIEIDPQMVQILSKRLSENGLDDRVNVICKDALRTEFPPFDLVVANIPYGISSPLIAKIVFGNSGFGSATLLLQKEFARRLLAKPGESEYNRLAVNVKLVADVEYIMDVSKRDFVPCPKVDSSVVKIYPKDKVPNVNMNEWWDFTRTCFSKKNKTLGATFKQKKKVLELLKRSQMSDLHEENAISYCFSDDGGEEEEDETDSSMCSELEFKPFKDKVIAVLKAGDFEDKRPSKLSNEELLRLLSLFNEAGIHFHYQTKKKGE